jgi:hypothetical protein
MRVFLTRIAVAGMLVGLASVAGAAMENDVDRPGSDYTSVTLPAGSGAGACEALCKADGTHCKAWTYVRPGVQAPNPRCWLKTAVPAPQNNGCCISGVKVPPVEMNVDRPGGDYTSVTLPAGAKAGACRDLCDADGGQCKAWTYVKAGVQAPNPRCWLTNTVPAAQASNCCTSGVK